jgi:thiamine biosynthesis lipoprotein
MSAETAAMARPRILHVMGTVVTVDIRPGGGALDQVAHVFDWFRSVDERFSAWRPDSEVSRFARGELAEADLSADMREILDACEEARVRSDGVFDIRRHRADGLVDPTGLVKGWSVDRAAMMLEATGARDFSLDAGGDAVVRGRPEPGRAWRVGIQHPLVRDRLAGVIVGTDLAVATSGTYERGEHIQDARSGSRPSGLLSMTVVGPALGPADAYATAAFAMGREGLAWLDGLSGYSGCAVTVDGQRVWTPGFDRYLV